MQDLRHGHLGVLSRIVFVCATLPPLSGLCTAFDIARPGSLQAGGRSPVLLHPHEHHLKALLQGGLEIAPLQLVTLWLIVQRVGAPGVAWGL